MSRNQVHALIQIRTWSAVSHVRALTELMLIADVTFQALYKMLFGPSLRNHSLIEITEFIPKQSMTNQPLSTSLEQIDRLV